MAKEKFFVVKLNKYNEYQGDIVKKNFALANSYVYASGVHEYLSSHIMKANGELLTCPSRIFFLI